MTRQAIRIKICGITRLQDAIEAVDCGAWAIGFILWPQSKRYISSEQASVIVKALRAANKLPTKIVGVFVNETQSTIAEAVETIGLTTVQLHGDESAAFVGSCPFEIIYAFRPQTTEDLSRITRMTCYAHLIDAAIEGHYGGTGQVADWQLAKAAVAFSDRLILSGGLNPRNIVVAYQAVQPFALDLSSGVEETPGIKSSHLIHELFQNLSKLLYTK